MRKLCLIILLAAGLLLLPFIAYGSYGTEAADTGTGAADKTPPPVAQTLVREGDFAVRLADKLGLVKTADEGKAEEVLAKVGIKPKSGWISDFPVTPDVLAEIRSSVQVAAGNGKINKDKGEADAEVLALSKDMGIETMAAAKGAKGYITGEQYGEETPPTEGDGEYEYQSPTVINNYYYEEGPPVVTYYPPPLDYAYLYAWNPFPFWYNTFYFPGYYVLRDFTTTVVVNSGGAVNINADKVIVKGDPNVSGAATTKVVSNRVFNRTINSTVTLDPVTRTASTTRAGARPFSTFNRGSARNIVAGSEGRMAGSFTNRGSIAPSNTGIAPSRGSISPSNTGIAPSRAAAGGVRSRGGTVTSSRNTASATVTGRGFDPAPSLRGHVAGSGGIAPVAPSRALSGKSFDPAPSLRGHAAGGGSIAPRIGNAPVAGRGMGIAPNRGFVAPARSFSQPAPAFSSSRGFVGSTRAFGAPSAGGRSFGGGSLGGRSLGGGGRR